MGLACGVDDAVAGGVDVAGAVEDAVAGGAGGTGFVCGAEDATADGAGAAVSTAWAAGWEGFGSGVGSVTIAMLVGSSRSLT